MTFFPKSQTQNLNQNDMELLLTNARIRSRRAVIQSVEDISKMKVSDGYNLQAQITNSLIEKHSWKVAGYKIGATNSQAQQRFNLNSPFYGPIFDKVVKQNFINREATRFSIKDDLIRGIEAEFALLIEKDITPRTEKYSMEELMTNYCSSVISSVEICSSRLPTTDKIFNESAPLLIADGAGNGAVVLQNQLLNKPEAKNVYTELPNWKASVMIDGKQVAQGSGANVLGNPAKSFEWFVQQVVNWEDGKVTLKKGQFVITGATCGLIPISRPCYVHVSFPDLKSDFHLAFRA